MASTSNRALLANYLLGQQSSAMGKNYIKNPSAFMNTIGVTASGTATVARNTTTPLTAISDFSVSLPNNATDYIEFATDTFDNSMSGKNCEVRLDYTASSIGSNVVIQVMQGSNVVASSSALSTASTARTVSVNAPCGDLSTASAIRVANGSGNSGTSSLKVANVTYGLATNLSQSAQATLVGSINYAPATNCIWSIASSTYADFPADTDCPTPTVTGQALAPTTKIPGIRFSSLPPGNYMFIVKGRTRSLVSSPTEDVIGVAMNDGSTVFGYNIVSNRASSTTDGQGPGIFEMQKEYTTALGDTTFRLHGRTGGGSATFEINNAATAYVGGFSIEVYRFPSSSELAYRPDQVAWRVDANIYGSNPSLGTSAQTAYAEITDASLTLAQNAGSISTQIACASGTASSGTTCTAANESIGISFTAPTAGDVLACVSFSHYLGATSLSGSVTFQIVETTNTSSAVVQESNSRIANTGDSPSGVFGLDSYPMRLCGILTFSSAGQKTLRLARTQSAISGTSVSNLILADRQVNLGNRDIHWEVYPLTQAIPAPLLMGSVTSNSTGLERVERVKVSGGVSPSVASQSGSWVSSISRTGLGDITLNVASGIFSSAPQCSCAIDAALGVCRFNPTPTTTAIRIQSFDSTFSLADRDLAIICMGPR